MKSSAEIRSTFLRFFEGQGHTIVPSSSLIPGNDPTLLFANAGMVQFKDVFLGTEKRAYTRATTAQKCMRVAGKHNDLENVGPSPRHHTFFEMLGNFSFGDYFKRDAISFAWTLITEQLGLEPERLFATVYTDDDQAAALWREVAGLPDAQIGRLGAKHNFWEMGDTGPCGPNSEIFYDRGKQYCTCGLPECNPVTGSVHDCERWWEFWNLVFMQFNRLPDQSLEPLPKPSVDTGMGFERMAAILQQRDSNYDTDLFMPMMQRVQELLGDSDAARRDKWVGYRVIADHSRAIAFLIADGVLPGNMGRNYVLRLILRRAARYGRIMGFRDVFMPQIVDVVIQNMGAHYQELRQRREFILEAVAQEEDRFLQTLDTGLSLFEGLAQRLQAERQTVVPGSEAFKLYDTYGFPLDLTKDVAKEQGLTVDEAGFRQAMDEQRARARASQHFVFNEESELYRQLALPATEFLGYDQTDAAAEVLALVCDGQSVSEATSGQKVQVVLNRSPFYAESGGQVGDTGLIISPTGRIRIEDTRRPVAELTAHYGQVLEGQVAVGDAVEAQVDVERRLDIARNHTATHLLHRALRQVLGDHARQSGSLVAPDRLRFDFTHLAAMTPEELARVEALVNDHIREDLPLVSRVISYREAIAAGTTALFGEKYGDIVRQVNIADYTSELCGGTHLRATGQIGLFVLLSEASIGSGLRRIEALTGRGAEEHVRQQAQLIAQVAATLETKAGGLLQKAEGLLAQLREQQHEIENLRRELAQRDVDQLLGQTQEVGGVRVLALQVEAADINALREMADLFRDRLGSAVIALAAAIEGKPALVITATADLVARGFDAVKAVREVGQVVGGGGGGRPNMAQAGGRDAAKIPDALALIPQVVARTAWRQA
ncbi:MAG: alanine--tRNA ligase [Chloroflexi bacterium]|nr:alanine--tRNA ligase [Chloroflexota bacterium]